MTLGIATAIFVGNILIIRPLFSGGYTPYMGSIESAFLTDARFISNNFPFASWDPQWYMGFPFHLFYTPGLPYMVAGLHLAFGVPLETGYRILTAIFYSLVPVSLFFFVYYLRKRRLPGVIAAVFYTLAPSFSYILPSVRGDAKSFGGAPWQLVVMLKYGEGPHIAALAFTPLAALAMMHAMRKPSFLRILMAALAIFAVAMINWIGLFALTLILFIVVVFEMLTGEGWQKLKVALAAIALSFCLSAFWFNISFIKSSLAFGGGGNLPTTLLGNVPALIVAVMVGGFVIIFANGKPKLQAAFIVGAWLGIFSFVVLGWEIARLGLVPQPNRYMPELNMAAVMALAIIIDWVLVRLVPNKVLRIASPAAAAAFVEVAVLLSMPFLQTAHTVTRPNPDVTATSEYQVARWLAEHPKNGYTYATGSHGFWLNVFSNAPQIRGGTDQGATNEWWNHVSYQINTGESGEISALWVKALDIDYVVVSYPGSADAYQDYIYPRKFEGLFNKVYENRSTAVFEPPQDLGLATTVDGEAFKNLPRIKNAIDSESLLAYLAQVEKGKPATVQWINNVRLDVKARVDNAQQGVLVRVTYDPGWHASSKGKSISIKEDPAGFMVLYPEAEGDFVIELTHGLTADIWLGYFITAITVLLLVSYLTGFWRRGVTMVQEAWEEAKGGEDVED